jgi:hypothetical protein
MPIPVNVVFSPSWWRRHYGISFEEPFYLDVETRIRNDVLMRRALFERFGLEEPDPRPRPIIGSMHIAGGFVLPALLGVPIRFSEDQAAWPMPRNLDRQAILSLRAVDIQKTWPMSVLIAQMDRLEEDFGYVVGDLNTAGIVNTSVELRGNDLFLDLLEDPELTDHLFQVVAEMQVRVGQCLRARTGTTSIAVNRSILDVDPAIHLTSNCSVSMISPALYEQRVLPHEMYAAERLAPYGIHHCGGNLQKYAPAYSRMPVRFFDVGWGSDAGECARLFPDAFLNLRMNPVRLLQSAPTEVYREVQDLLRSCGRRNQVGMCCINMDAETPDANVRAMFQAARDFEAQYPV